MDLNLDLSGRRVLVVGGFRESRHTIARYLAAGASIYLSSENPAPVSATLQAAEFPTAVAGWRDLVSAVDLVVSVDPGEQVERMLAEACADRHTWLTHDLPANTSAIGRVTLVGGGPGDEGLFTIAGKEALRTADVVYYDRLAPHAHLSEWAAGADLINVGKSPGHHAVSQPEIERMLVASALAGNKVVRLKGGDPFVFGRGGEEVIACRDAGVPVTVIPGVTSAIAVPAAAGIPVTHREISRMFTVLSGHAPLSEDELKHLVGLGGTIVVLMGVTNLPHLAAGLARQGMRADMPVAIIERGYSARQRTTVASIATIVPTAAALDAQSPAVLVIGEVVRLAHDGSAGAAELLRDAVTLADQR
jgi:uroporphyrin-III C-methyltransferase